MSDFTHARVCIRHGSGSVEIQAPAGEVTWLDLSGLHALPIATGNEGRRKGRLLIACLLFGCSAVAGVGVSVASSSHFIPDGVRAEVPAMERSAAQQAFLSDVAAANTVQAPRGVPAAAPGTDPFGLKR